ncbi:MAG: DUF4838 domain-containing protein [Colwellia sp.]|nr:DUF4838 domain-containing protein [Colwellia sp.]
MELNKIKSKVLIIVISFVISFAWGGIFTTTNAAQGVKLFLKKELIQWNIVRATNAIPSELHAVKVFHDLIYELTGVSLEIVDNIDRDDKHIFIGTSEMMKESNVGFGIEGLGEEDFRIIIADNNIAIAGGRRQGTEYGRGTLYGVYTFIEDYAGIRFLTVDHTHIPQYNPGFQEKVLGPIDRTYHPPLSFRLSAYKVNYDHPEFGAELGSKMRCNYMIYDHKYGGDSPISLFNHSFVHLLPWETYGKNHPEYFARWETGEVIYKDNSSQLCLTNKDVLKIVTEAVFKVLDANPDQKSISVSQNDSGLKCRCSNCEAIDQPEESGAATLLLFVNAVAGRVAQKYPDRNIKVGTLAYKYSQKPPKTIVPRDNVIIQLTTHDCSITDPIETSNYEASVKFRNALKGWNLICDYINIWYYNGNLSQYPLPCPNMRVLQKNILYLVKNRVKGIYAQGHFNDHNMVGLEDLMNYMTSRLLWNPYDNAEELMEDFLTKHYRYHAGTLIKDFINLMHDSAEEKGIQHGWTGWAINYGMDREVIDFGLNVFEHLFMEIDKDNYPKLFKRLQRASIGFYLLGMNEAFPWCWPDREPQEGEPTQGNSPGKELVPDCIQRRTRENCKKFFELALSNEFKITYLSGDDLFGKHSENNLKVGFGLERNDPWLPYPIRAESETQSKIVSARKKWKRILIQN